MNSYKRDRTYEDRRKVVEYSATFNSTSKLEFNIFPDSRYLDLGQTQLKFGVEIPSQMVPDNFMCSNMFENLEIYINHELGEITYALYDLISIFSDYQVK